jgi:hypothetical protein
LCCACAFLAGRVEDDSSSGLDGGEIAGIVIGERRMRISALGFLACRRGVQKGGRGGGGFKLRILVFETVF